MNARHRKEMRLRSRHARRGHTPFCNCPEEIDRMLLEIRKRFGEGWAGIYLSAIEESRRRGRHAEDA